MTDDEIELLAYEAMQREDFGLAERLFTSLENKESDYALTSLGWMHKNGYLGAPNKKLARTYFERAMSIGSANAYYETAIILANERKFVESRETIDKGMAIENNDRAQEFINLKSIVSDHLALKEFERKHYKEAFLILQSQSSPESVYTLSTLGWLYHTGLAGIMDKDLARLYYRRAGELGSVDIHFQIGLIELSENNNEAARTAFHEGAKLEHLPSISKLAEMMIEGQGGSIEIEQGIKLLISCAEKGHILSKIRLLRIEINGTRSSLDKIVKRLKYVIIIFDLIKEITKKSQPSNYYEFR